MKKILILIIILAIGVTAYLGLSRRYRERPKNVGIDVVKRERIETFILCTGRIEPCKEITIRARQDGRVKKVLVEEGDNVRSNQAILLFDKKEDEITLIQAENRLKMAEIELKEAAEHLKRTEILYGASATSGLKLIEAQTRYEKAGVERDDAEETRRLTKIRLDGLRCTSPHKGVVIETKVEDSQVTEKGQELFVIADLSNLQVKADVDEIDAVSVACGQKAIITHEALQDKEFLGEVVKIAPKAEEKPPTTILEVIIKLKEKDSHLRPGMQVDAKIITGDKNGLFLPLKAVKEDKEGMVIFMIKNGLACKNRIETGVISLDKVEVLGLSEGEEVIVSPVSEGDRVLR
jgi:HlyD family secretion protein